MKFEVNIIETWTKAYTLEAHSAEDARKKVTKLYHEETGHSLHEGIALDLDAVRSGMRVDSIKEI